MKIQWFVEERSATADWQAAIYHGDKPAPTSAGGKSRTFRADPQPVPFDLYHEDINVVRSFLSPDGEFYGVELEPVLQYLNGDEGLINEATQNR